MTRALRPLRVVGWLALFWGFASTWTQALAQSLPPGAPEAAPPEYLTDANERPFRVRFDPGSRALFGIGVAVATDDAASWLWLPELQANFQNRSFYRYGEGDELVSWRLDHRLFDFAWFWPSHRVADLLFGMGATFYQGQYLRHAEAPYILIPSSPPVRLFFPFDVGFDLVVGRVWMPAHGFVNPSPNAVDTTTPEVPLMRITALGTQIVLDPWRSGRPGDSLEIGVGVRYDLDLEGDNQSGLDNPEVIHRVAPFTSTSIRLHLEDDPGLTAFDLRGEVTPHWASEHEDWQLMAAASLHVERVLIAINDQPLALTLDSTYRHHPATDRIPATNEWRSTLGLALLIQGP